MNNPASAYATSLGLTTYVEVTPTGERGMVILPDGRRVEEWSLYRGEIPGYPSGIPSASESYQQASESYEQASELNKQATEDYKKSSQSWALVGLLILGACAYDVVRKKR